MFELKKRIHIENEKLELLIKSVSLGIPIKYACQKAQIPLFYYYKWLKLYDDYMKEIESKDIEIEDDVVNPKPEGKSKNTSYFYTPVSLILAIKEAQADFVILQHSKISQGGKDWQSSAWLLERRCRDEYGKESLEQTNSNQVQGIKVLYVDTDNQDTKERLERLTKEAEESLHGTNRN